MPLCMGMDMDLDVHMDMDMDMGMAVHLPESSGLSPLMRSSPPLALAHVPCASISRLPSVLTTPG